VNIFVNGGDMATQLTIDTFKSSIENLDELAVAEYGQSITEVANSLSEEHGPSRMYYGRLLGILLKEPFSEIQPAELAQAKRRWELIPERLNDKNAQRTWQYEIINQLQKESTEYTVESYSSLSAMVQEVKHETGFFWHLLRSFRKYVCNDPKFAGELEKKINEARKTGTAVSLPSASIAATLATMLATQIPWLGIASAPLIAGTVILFWQIGADAFCSWSEEIISYRVWYRDS